MSSVVAAKTADEESDVTLWAPRVERASIVVGDQKTPLVRGDDGVHRAKVKGLVEGARYGFFVGDEGPFPDPRSRAQPDGVHKLSAVVDVGDFQWTDQRFVPPPWKSAVVYELHIGTFSKEGTFDGAIAHLDHLKDLGVTHVEVLPISAFAGERGWGYDGVALWAAHAAYGGAPGFCRFVDACHARGLAVVLDVVYNHLGPSGNYLPKFGPYFTDKYKTPWGEALNYDDSWCDGVRAYVIENALMWLKEHHVDALRLDAIHAIHDESALPMLEELTTRVRALSKEMNKEHVLIAESDLNDPKVVRPTSQHGLGFDASWSDDFHHALHVALTGETRGYYGDYDGLSDLAHALSHGYVHDGAFVKSRQRRHGRSFVEGASGDGARLLAYAQNHDQVGNRAHGERLTTLAGDKRARIALALTLTSPFIPMLFQGEEWGALTPFLYFVDHEPELAKLVFEGRKKEFAAFHEENVPDPQATSSFQQSKLSWSDPSSSPHKETLAFTRALLQLRRTIPALGAGDVGAVDAQADAQRGTLLVRRGDVVIAVSLAKEERRLALPWPATSLLSSEPVRAEGAAVLLPPDSVAILRRA